MVLVYKIINGLSYINFHDYFYLINTNYNLRRNSLQIKPLYQIKSTNSSWLNSFFNRVPTLWNALPNEIVTSSNLTNFKQKIRKYNFVNQPAFEWHSHTYQKLSISHWRKPRLLSLRLLLTIWVPKDTKA